MPLSAAYTSVAQVPAAFKRKDLAHVFMNGHNLDWGGGRYDQATTYLRDELGCHNAVYDPYNRPGPHNREVLEGLDSYEVPPSSITLLNVLNVIPGEEERKTLLRHLRLTAKRYSTIRHIVIQIYEGPSKASTQMSKPTAYYLPEIQEHLAGEDWKMSRAGGSRKNIIVLSKGEPIMAVTKKSTEAARLRKIDAEAKRTLTAQLSTMFAIASPTDMAVTDCQVYLTKEAQLKTVAFARVVLNGCLQLTSLRVIDGSHGLFVAYPNDANYKGDDYRSIYYPITKELREHIEAVVLAKYEEALRKGGQ